MKVAVFFPRPWRGGMLRSLQSFCDRLLAASDVLQLPLTLVVSVLRDTYQLGEIKFSDQRVSIRDTRWATVAPEEQSDLGLTPIDGPGLVRPIDGGHDFMDCDFWIVFGAYFEPIGVLAPLQPYFVYAPDFIQRYVPEIYFDATNPLDHGWRATLGLILTLRGAREVLVTTPKTGQDAVGYAGVDPSRVRLMPLWSLELPSPLVGTPQPWERPYFLWVTNPTPHKNHRRAIATLEGYYKRGGSLDVLTVGPQTLVLSPKEREQHEVERHPYWDEIAELIVRSRRVQDRLHFLGEVDEVDYVGLISAARFVWHNVIYDNGTFVALEAARLGTPLLSSDYPQMRYISEVFGINTSFFPPLEVPAAINALQTMELATVEKRAPAFAVPASWEQNMSAAFEALLLHMRRQ
jgi:glycosyltransferase involved in cell wall biosynthesis